MTKPKTLLVTAAHADRPCPMIRTRIRIDQETGRDRTMIYSDQTVEVPNVRFYRRRLQKGDLVLAAAVPRRTKPQSKPKTEPKQRASETE